MGGRSRKREEQENTRWGFIKELSDERLENYGVYTRKFLNSQGGLGGIYNKESFNWELAKEYENRHGYRPEWETTALQANEYWKQHYDPETERKERENEQARRSGKKYKRPSPG
jgi:hypothetical protein